MLTANIRRRTRTDPSLRILRKLTPPEAAGGSPLELGMAVVQKSSQTLYCSISHTPVI